MNQAKTELLNKLNNLDGQVIDWEEIKPFSQDVEVMGKVLTIPVETFFDVKKFVNEDDPDNHYNGYKYRHFKLRSFWSFYAKNADKFEMLLAEINKHLDIGNNENVKHWFECAYFSSDYVYILAKNNFPISIGVIKTFDKQLVLSVFEYAEKNGLNLLKPYECFGYHIIGGLSLILYNKGEFLDDKFTQKFIDVFGVKSILKLSSKKLNLPDELKKSKEFFEKTIHSVGDVNFPEFSFFQHADDELKKDAEFILSIKYGNFNQELFRNIDNSLKDDKDFALGFLKGNKYIYSKLCKKLQDDKDIIICAINAGRGYGKFGKKARSMPDIFIHALKAGVVEKNDDIPDVIYKNLDAIKLLIDKGFMYEKADGKRIYSLEKLGDMKYNKDVVKHLAAENVSLMMDEFKSDDKLKTLLADDDFAIELCLIHPKFFRSLDESKRNDYEFLKKLVSVSGYVYQVIDEKYYADRDIMFLSAGNYGGCYERASDDLKKDIDFAYKCAETYVNVYLFMPDEFKGNEDFYFSAFKLGVDLDDVLFHYKTPSKDFIIKCMNLRADEFYNIPHKFKRDIDVVYTAIKNDIRCIRHAGPDIKNLIADADDPVKVLKSIIDKRDLEQKLSHITDEVPGKKTKI